MFVSMIRRFGDWFARRLGLRIVTAKQYAQYRLLKENHRKDMVLVGLGGPLRGKYTPIPVEYTGTIPPAPRLGEPAHKRMTLAEPWEAYRAAAEARTRAEDPDQVIAIILPIDEAERAGYERWHPPSHRQFSYGE